VTPPRLLYRSAKIAPARSSVICNLTPATLGWERIHFSVRQLAAGDSWSARDPRRERCIVLLRGHLRVRIDGITDVIGPRADVFGSYPHAVYAPPGTTVSLEAIEGSEIAEGRAPSTPRAGGALAPRVIRPEDCGFEIRGGGNATRQIVDILPPSFAADRLMVCEVFTPSGNWSSYPPHKHDTDDPPREADLEEIYYFRYREPDGYGYQRVYNGRRDDTVRVTHGDVVAVRDGYHPFVTAYGFDAYYLNVLAGSRRSMAATDDPRYARFREAWPAPDPRLPMVPRPLRP
jgi:5-deoxy-glucuronate isomerase